MVALRCCVTAHYLCTLKQCFEFLCLGALSQCTAVYLFVHSSHCMHAQLWLKVAVLRRHSSCAEPVVCFAIGGHTASWFAIKHHLKVEYTLVRTCRTHLASDQPKLARKKQLTCCLCSNTNLSRCCCAAASCRQLERYQ
jgi:hypothetical protein